MQRLSLHTDTPAVRNIVIINIIMFIITMIYNNHYAADNMIEHDLSYLLGLHYIGSTDFRPWQIITHMFMHAGMMHIFFNMFTLLSFGAGLEKLWGPKKFIFFYIICGIGAAMASQLIEAFKVYQACQTFVYNEYALTALQAAKLSGDIGIAVGASGAIFGLLAAYALLSPNREVFIYFIPIPIKIKYVVIGLLALNLYLGISKNAFFGYENNVAYIAHIGGAITGFILIQYWKKDRTTFW